MKLNELNFPPNLEGLVLGCIDASKQASKVVQSFSKKREKKEKRPRPPDRAENLDRTLM